MHYTQHTTNLKLLACYYHLADIPQMEINKGGWGSKTNRLENSTGPHNRSRLHCVYITPEAKNTEDSQLEHLVCHFSA